MTSSFSVDAAATSAARGSQCITSRRSSPLWLRFTTEPMRKGASLAAALLAWCVLSIGVARADSYWYTDDDGYADDIGYFNGFWYSSGPDGYVVVEAPIGAFVSVLPPHYTTVWVADVPYYYSNDAYYIWRPNTRRYEAVAPPDGNEATTEPTAPRPSPNAAVFAYPKSGQSEDQQARDKYECHKWARGRASTPLRRVEACRPRKRPPKRVAYRRAMGVCLEGRGYTVK